MGGIYSINTPEKLFSRMVIKYSDFNASPTEELLFDLIFPLCHLREWICPGGYKVYAKKSPTEYSKEEQLHAQIYEMPEFKVIQSLCNAAKHYNLTANIEDTRIVKGSRAGLLRAGDRLGRTYFLLDGIELRDYFRPVYAIYYQYFSQKQI